MNFRLRTSKKAEEQIKALQNSVNLQPNVLARLAISVSLMDSNPIDISLHRDQNGLEFNRVTLTGEYDAIYKALIIQHTGENLSDEDYFPLYFKAHLERGVPLLNDIYNYAGNYEKFVLQLSNMVVS
ncbi:DndE family protein [Paenibacillus cymbidii]|uniref:DndE family protein n=1 Tax=Paenibacillus cymbidii TaxID=1639034 RepID=UPI0010808290|nr:DndE family protein [Paenibacillus cymbidii]